MINQWIKDALNGKDEVAIDYPDGGFLSAKAGGVAYILYSNVDAIVLKYIDCQYQVTGIDTHDDLQFKY